MEDTSHKNLYQDLEVGTTNSNSEINYTLMEIKTNDTF